MSKKQYSYDEKVEELVRYFMQHEPASEIKEDMIKELSQHIQLELETWIVNEVDMRAKEGKD
jgi:hypothetical protein